MARKRKRHAIPRQPAPGVATVRSVAAPAGLHAARRSASASPAARSPRLAAREVINALSLAARCAQAQYRYADAMRQYREAAALTGVKRDPLEWAHTQEDIAFTHVHEGRLRDAEQIFREMNAVRTQVQGPEHPSTLLSRSDVARMLDDQGRHAEADAEHRAVLASRPLPTWSSRCLQKPGRRSTASLRRSPRTGRIFKAGKINYASGRQARSDSGGMKQELKITRERMIEFLNEDLAREFQAVIAYTVYSQTLKGAAFSDIARELAVHATEELSHAMQIARQVAYFNGTPVTAPKEVKMSDKAEDMLRFDLENERVTILNYRERILQAEAMGEFGLSEVLRKIIAQEQEHFTDLAGALGIDNPAIEDPKA